LGFKSTCPLSHKRLGLFRGVYGVSLEGVIGDDPGTSSFEPGIT